MIAVSGVSVDHDGKGCSAPDPLVWDHGRRRKVRGTGGFLNGPWMQVQGGCITGADVAAWPYSVGILCKFTASLGTLHWPCDAVYFLEVLVLFGQWAGHRLLSEKVTRPHVRTNRPILIPSVPVSEGIEIRHRCQFVSALVRAFSKLPGGMGRFLPCGIGPHMSRLRHLGWNRCSHGLSSRPLESCHHQCLVLYVVFWAILRVQKQSFLTVP